MFNVFCHEGISNKSCEVTKYNLSNLEMSEEPAGRYWKLGFACSYALTKLLAKR